MAGRPIIAIVGPTGVGKTKLGIALVKAMNGEVISVDILQTYRHGGIMTAKPTIQEMDGVTHHLIDYLQPDRKAIYHHVKFSSSPQVSSPHLKLSHRCRVV